jgi:hypothetical protein
VYVQLAVKLPSFVFALMIALPGEFAVTTPAVETDAVEESVVSQVMSLFAALAGETVATKVASVNPTARLTVLLFSVTPLTATGVGDGVVVGVVVGDGVDVGVGVGEALGVGDVSGSTGLPKSFAKGGVKKSQVANNEAKTRKAATKEPSFFTDGYRLIW